MSNAIERAGRRLSPVTRPARRRAAAILLLAAAWLAGPRAEAQVHPFYLEAQQEGAAAHDRGDFARAAERLRIASFGMLDEPDQLAATLTRLALAQAALGQRQEFVATFERISRLEVSFTAYSNARISSALRGQFEGQATQWVAAPTLQASAFARLLREQELQRVQALLPGARARELEELVTEHPEDLQWQLMLATARVESGAGADAIAALEGPLAHQLDTPRVACLLGRAYLQARRCEPLLATAAERVQRCDVRRLPNDELDAYLECLSAAERWIEAASIVVSLAPERRGTRAFRKWEKRIAANIEPGLEVETLPPHEATAGTPPGVATQSAPPRRPAAAEAGAVTAPATPLRVPSADIQTLRRQLNQATDSRELQAVAKAAEEMRRLYPDSAEPMFLAGEAAYRASEWQRAADYLRANGGPPDDRPELLFYLAVSLHELGDHGAAAETLQRALPLLENSPIVERYRREILE